MSTKQTIKQLFTEAHQHLTDDELELAEATAGELRSRRLNKSQKEQLKELEIEIENYGEPKYTMSKQLQKYRGRYQVCVTSNGTKSLNNGDPIAQLLEGKSWEEVCKLADEVLGEEPGHHATKYANLNPGQRRMNSGNRIRAAWKRGEYQPEV